jgi:hypothetical protein
VQPSTKNMEGTKNSVDLTLWERENFIYFFLSNPWCLSSRLCCCDYCWLSSYHHGQSELDPVGMSSAIITVELVTLPYILSVSGIQPCFRGKGDIPIARQCRGMLLSKHHALNSMLHPSNGESSHRP